MSTWSIHARFPGDLKTRLEGILEWVNSKPDRIAEVSKNDLIVFAVQRLVTDLEVEMSSREGSTNGQFPPRNLAAARQAL